MERVAVNPKFFRWASDRSGQAYQSLTDRFPHLSQWESGEEAPTLKQLEDFAHTTFTPIGYFFLQEPPFDELPIHDFRKMADTERRPPSPNLLETIYICQERQDWYHDFAVSNEDDPLEFVGSATIDSNVEQIANDIRRTLAFELSDQRESPNSTDALRQFIERADAAGLLVMVSGVVGSNNRRKLDPKEFRGFALVDKFAPLVFINGADAKAAQMFTLAHEIAHIWLGRPGVSDVQIQEIPEGRIERWCNEVAAEFLVPIKVLRDQFRRQVNILNEVPRLAKYFKVSALVILRRIYELGGISKAVFQKLYDDAVAGFKGKPKSSGGDFYRTQAARVGKRFARAIIISTLEGQTLHRDAFRLLGFSKIDTFHRLGHSLGVG